MGEEEKGFVVKDRRSLDDKGDLREKEPEEKPVKKEEKKPEPPRDQEQRIPLPEEPAGKGASKAGSITSWASRLTALRHRKSRIKGRCIGYLKQTKLRLS